MSNRQNRSSAIGFNAPFNAVLPPPAAGVSAADREQVAFSYAGILAGAFVVPPQVIYYATVQQGGYSATVSPG